VGSRDPSFPLLSVVFSSNTARDSKKNSLGCFGWAPGVPVSQFPRARWDGFPSSDFIDIYSHNPVLGEGSPGATVSRFAALSVLCGVLSLRVNTRQASAVQIQITRTHQLRSAVRANSLAASQVNTTHVHLLGHRPSPQVGRLMRHPPGSI
jgi:hypothetical protein